VDGLRVGWGFDAHRFGGPPPVLIGGVSIDHPFGVDATSDGDVAAHALTDAVLGTASLGDIGMHFPSSDPAWVDADSLEFVRAAVRMAGEAGVEPVHADVTVVAQSVRVAPHRDAVRGNLAEALGIPLDAVSVKATTTDGMGFVGRDEGIAAMAVVTARTIGLR
jgi:2-C-methyl-D-erythritol 2,4-cyclodiphosphate synthase